MRVPSSTYRLQFNGSFGLKDAMETLEYLSALGITDVYASPIFKSRSGSLHGYDIVDPDAINPEVGDTEQFVELMGRLKALDMGWVQDVVANHMAYDGGNSMLMDVLEKGKSSRFFGFFDIEWDHPYEGIKDKVLAPFLGRIYGEALESGEIRLEYAQNGLSVSYYGFKFPLKIDSYAYFLTYGLRKLTFQLGRDHPDFIKLLGILYVLKNLPGATEDNELQDQVTFVKRMLWELYTGNRDISRHIDENAAAFNGTLGDPESFNLLDKLLSEQFFKLSFWKVAAEEINYRRFFNINELITLKAEDEQVFDRLHAFLFRLIGYGITGLRIDHIDGLYNPLAYLRRLRESAGDLYMVVEKILGADEELPFIWPVEGTTGYDFLNNLNGIFCDTSNETRFNRIYSSFTGIKASYADLFYEKKKLITEMDMMSDVGNLAQLLKITLVRDRYGSDITLQGLKKAIVEVMAAFPVYRTYISAESAAVDDIRRIKDSANKAIMKNPALINELTFIEKVLTLNYRDYLGEAEKNEWIHFVMRFQQFTGPLMAKGIEDTLMYVYNRLLSLNEVGGSPGRFGHSLDLLHSRNRLSAELLPHSMNATSTHDTKRGEDMRARINALSEIPDEWGGALRRWSGMNRRKKRTVNGSAAPDRNDEYFLYQTLLGSFPFDEKDLDEYAERIKAYIIKAVREAKIHTAWLRPDKEYEDAFLSFIEEVLKDPQKTFLNEFLPFQKKIAWFGIFNSLSQTLLKITSPGVPDFYQGTELWDFSLVDPDNRRPVDFSVRKTALKEIQDGISNRGGLITTLLKTPEDGKIKFFLTSTALEARKRRKEVFTDGSYIPLLAEGPLKGSVVAFARAAGREAALVAAPRFLSSVIKEGSCPLGEVWGDTVVRLPEGLRAFSWRNFITGESVSGELIRAADLFRTFPASLLFPE